MNGPSRYQTLIDILLETRLLLSRPGNDFAWSGWEDDFAALEELDRLIVQLGKGTLPGKSDLAILYAPTGPIQETSINSGWSADYLELADRFDKAVEAAYRQ